MDEYSILLEGNVEVTIENDQNRILYSLESKDITFSFGKAGEKKVCGYTLICV